MKKKVNLTGNDIQEMVSTSVKKVLNEVSYQTLHSASDKATGVDFYEVFEAIKTINSALGTYDSDSFHKPHAAWDHFTSTGREPVDAPAEKFGRYLDEIKAYFERKEKQADNLYKALPGKYEEYEKEILRYLNQFGYQGNDIESIINQMDYDEIEEFKDSLPEELATFFEENI